MSPQYRKPDVSFRFKTPLRRLPTIGAMKTFDDAAIDALGSLTSEPPAA